MFELPDTTNVEPADNAFDPLPPGWYVAQVEKAEFRRNAADTGTGLNLQIRITEGQYSNRVVFDLLNLDNPNPIAVEIAQRALASLRQAIGMAPNIRDPQLLCGVTFECKLKVEAASSHYEAKNRVQAYRANAAAAQQQQAQPWTKPPATAAQPAAAQQQQQQAAPAADKQAPAPAAAPWE